MSVHNVFAHDITGDDLGSRMSIAIKKEQMVKKQGQEFDDDVKRRKSMVNIKRFVKDLKEGSFVQKQEDTGRRESQDDSGLELKIDQLEDETEVKKSESADQAKEKDELEEIPAEGEAKEEKGEKQDEDGEEASSPTKTENQEEEKTSSSEANLEVKKDSPLGYTVEERKDRDIFDKVPSFFAELEQRQAPKWFPEKRRHSYSACLEEQFILNIPDSEDFPREKCLKFIDQGQMIEANNANLEYLIKKEAGLWPEKKK